MEQWKYRAVDKLRDYEAQKTALLNLRDEIATLESEARGIKSATADAVAVQGGGSRREDRLLSNIVQREELKEAMRRAMRQVRMVERGLETLDSEERRILQVMHITKEPKAADRLASELGLDDIRSVYKRADKALRHFTIALYGITEG